MTVFESQVHLNLLFILTKIPHLHNACVVVRSGLYVTGMKDLGVQQSAHRASAPEELQATPARSTTMALMPFCAR